MPLTRRWPALTLGLLLLALAASSLTTILRDNRPLSFDPAENLVSTVLLERAVRSLDSADYQRWVHFMGFRPPLPAIVSLPAAALIPDHVVAVRVTDLAFLLLCVWMIYRLGVRLSGPAAGLAAALLFAAFPLVQSWGRMGNGDPVIWFSLLLVFRIALELDLRAPWQAAVLGAVMSLCMLTRLLTLVFLVGPILWILLLKVRDRRALLNLVAAGLWAIAGAGWWYLLKLDAIYYNLVHSASRWSDPTDVSGVEYLRVWPLLLLAVVAAFVVVWRKRLLSREHIALFGLWIGVAALQLALVWDFWDRYPLSILPQGALLIAVAVDRLTRDRGRTRAVACAGLVLVTLVPLGYWHLSEINLRHSGLFVADTRPYDAMERALAAIPPSEPVLLINEVYNPSFALGRFLAREGRRRLVIDQSAPVDRERHSTTRVRYVVRVTERGPRDDGYWRAICRHTTPRIIFGAQDPDWMEYYVARLPDPGMRMEQLDF